MLATMPWGLLTISGLYCAQKLTLYRILTVVGGVANHNNHMISYTCGLEYAVSSPTQPFKKVFSHIEDTPFLVGV